MLIEEHLDIEKHFKSVGDFCCGADDPLNIFLSDQSFQYEENHYGMTYILRESDCEDILAYYTLKTSGIQIYDEQLNLYNGMPVIEISRIAVAHDLQQNGFGKRIFYDYIMPKIYTVMQYVAVKAIMVLVDQDNISGIKFYTSLQFSSVDEGVQKIVDDSFNENCKLYLLIL